MNDYDFFNEDEVRKSIAILKPDRQLFEIRILDSRKKVLSGYFTDADTAIAALKSVNLRGCNVYFTLGNIKEGCYARVQRDQFRAQVTTTSDTDIAGYQWMLIDFDPVRSADISSTREELAKAKELAAKVYSYLQDMGFGEPVKALSGNGYHLLYRINIANNDESRELVHNCLNTLDVLFSNDDVHVDTTNYNPARICKLHGTLAQKGANTPERPHRISHIYDGKEPQLTQRIYLEKLAGQIEHKEKPTYKDARPGAKFDVLTFMQQHGMDYMKTSTGRDASTVYHLCACPFDSNHKNGDAKVFAYPDGRISFKCHHNSCSGKTWQDVRLYYEPEAYSSERTSLDAQIEEGWKRQNKLRQQPQEQPVAQEEMFRTAAQIMEDDEPDHEFVRSGVTVIDENMFGLQKQCVSVISGLRGSGKTTLMGTFILSAVQNGQTVVVYSGELSNKKYLGWIDRQAAGKNHVEVSVKYAKGVGVSVETQHKIHEWLGERFWLYNNKKGNQFSKIAVALEQILTEKKADLCIIDNMMALDLEPKSDKYDAQTDFVWALKNIAIRTNTHIIFVAHPKKVPGFIRLDDISGAGNIGNIVDNAFMVHRNNEDFKSRLKDFSKTIYSSLDLDTATNFVEIAKDREGGLQDVFIPLYFEESSKRLKNRLDENVVYGWLHHAEWEKQGFTVIE